MDKIENAEPMETVEEDDPVGESMRHMLDKVKPQQSIATVLESIVRYALANGWNDKKIKQFLTKDEEFGLILGDHVMFTIDHGITVGTTESNVRKIREKDITRVKEQIRSFIPRMESPMETLDTQVMGITEEGWNPESLQVLLCDNDFVDEITEILKTKVIPKIVDEIVQRLKDHENGLTDALKNELRKWLSQFDPTDPVSTKLELVADELTARDMTGDAALRHVLQFLRNDPEILAQWKRNFKTAIERGINNAPDKKAGVIDEMEVRRAIMQHLPRLRHGDTMYRLFAEKLPVGKGQRNDVQRYAEKELDNIVHYVTETVTRDIVLETVLKRREGKPGKILRERDIKPLVIEDFFMRVASLLDRKTVSYDDRTDRSFFDIAKDAIGARAAICRVDKEAVSEWIDSPNFRTRFITLMRDKIKDGMRSAVSRENTVDDDKTKILTMAANAQLTLLTPERDLTRHDVIGNLGGMLAQSNGNIPAIMDNIFGTEAKEGKQFIDTCDNLLRAIQATAERQVENVESILRGMRRNLRATLEIVRQGAGIKFEITRPKGGKKNSTVQEWRLIETLVDDVGTPDEKTVDRLIEHFRIEHLRAEVYRRLAAIGTEWFKERQAKSGDNGRTTTREIIAPPSRRGRRTPPRDKRKPKTGGRAAGKMQKNQFRREREK